MLITRIITALILIPLTLVMLFYLPPSAFLIMTALIMLAGAWEWTNFMGLQQVSAKLLYLLCMLFAFAFVLFIPFTAIFIFAFIWWVVATLLIILYPRVSACWSAGILVRGIMGVCVLTPCWTALNYIRSQNDGIYTLLFVLVLIWGADTAAYFAGRKWGKTKLAPLVSPGKSIQGLIGALLGCTLIAIIALIATHIPLVTWPWVILLSITTVLFSVVGDLFESMMKRQVGLKDSGKLLPGHGGLLDRIDSLTAAAPVFVFGGLMLSKYLN